MTFILLVHDEIAKDHSGEYEFDTLKEAKELTTKKDKSDV